jgi:hypothetical protein
MEKYQNQGGNSGAVGYEFTDDGIKVKFRDKAVYLYTEESTGREHIKEMKKLAVAGKGLTTYINRNVRQRYAKKIA